MKKIMVAFMMAVVMVMSVMVIGPEEAFAIEMNGIHNEDVANVKILGNAYERFFIENSDEVDGMRLIGQRIAWFDELGVYEWTVNAYDPELHQIVEDTVRVSPDDIDEIVNYLKMYNTEGF